MKKHPLTLIRSFIAGVIAVTSAQFAANAQTSVQNPCNTIGTGSNAFHYLVMEGESYVAESKTADPSIGFTKLYNDEAVTSFYGNPMLATNTGASMQGALGTIGPLFGRFADKITYQVVFSKPGDYYMYMRFTMFENGSNLGGYTSEDSFFFPPDFNKDPELDWPVPGTSGSDDGGYTEGCCGGAGFLFILDYQGDGSRTDYSGGANTNFWEGNFHWNQLFVSQFLNTTTFTNADGSPLASRPFHYVVTPGMVGVPQNFTIAYREQGVTVDSFLFSTHTNMLNDYTQDQLDQLIVKKVAVQQPENTVTTPTNSYPFLVMEAENFVAKTNRDTARGFIAVSPGGTNIAFYGSHILETNTTASGKGALLTQSPAFGLFSDKISYRVQFESPGDYYLYFRFTMYENGGNLAHYISEDSFFVPPDFNKDPEFDWNPPGSPSSNNGGYTEGCCGGSGFLHILNYQGDGTRTDRSADTNYWEGNFHWNQLFVSQFLSTTTFTNADGSPLAGNPFHYVVTTNQVGVPMSFTIAFREAGVTPDLFLFSTHTNLLNDYTQEQMDQNFLQPKLAISSTGTNVVVSWPVSAACFMLESSTGLTPASWTAEQTPAALVGTRNILTVDPIGTKFYRLRQP